MFDNFRRFGRIRSVISVGSVRFGSVTGFIHSPWRMRNRYFPCRGVKITCLRMCENEIPGDRQTRNNNVHFSLKMSSLKSENELQV